MTYLRRYAGTSGATSVTMRKIESALYFSLMSTQ